MACTSWVHVIIRHVPMSYAFQIPGTLRDYHWFPTGDRRNGRNEEKVRLHSLPRSRRLWLFLLSTGGVAQYLAYCHEHGLTPIVNKESIASIVFANLRHTSPGKAHICFPVNNQPIAKLWDSLTPHLSAFTSVTGGHGSLRNLLLMFLTKWFTRPRQIAHQSKISGVIHSLHGTAWYAATLPNKSSGICITDLATLVFKSSITYWKTRKEKRETYIHTPTTDKITMPLLP